MDKLSENSQVQADWFLNASGIELHTPEWIAAKKKNVGGSEVAALYGVSEYQSYFGLWMAKAGHISGDVEDNLAMQFGRIWEESVMQMACIQGAVSDKCVKANQLVLHPTIKGMSCSLDFVDFDEDGNPILVEIKTIHPRMASRLIDGDAPVSYQLQCQHGMACTGMKKAKLIMWVIGEYEVKIFDYNRDDMVVHSIEQEVKDFWESITVNAEPEPDFRTDYDVIRELYADASEAYVQFDGIDAEDAFDKVAAKYITVNQKKKDLEATLEALKAEIAFIMKDKTKCGTPNYFASNPIVKRRRKTAWDVIYEAAGKPRGLIERIKDDPNVLMSIVVTEESSYRRLTIKQEL